MNKCCCVELPKLFLSFIVAHCSTIFYFFTAKECFVYFIYDLQNCIVISDGASNIHESVLVQAVLAAIVHSGTCRMILDTFRLLTFTVDMTQVSFS